MAAKPNVSFDEEGRIRVLDPQKYKATEQLEVECRTFVSKLFEFSETVDSIVQVLNDQSDHIEKAKLRAIGQRNLVDNERENRVRRQQEIQALINEKLAEKERLSAHLESLVRIEQEQREMIGKLQDNEAS